MRRPQEPLTSNTALLKQTEHVGLISAACFYVCHLITTYNNVCMFAFIGARAQTAADKVKALTFDLTTQWFVLTQASRWAVGYRGHSRQPSQTGGFKILARYEHHGADARRDHVTGHPGGRSLRPC